MPALHGLIRCPQQNQIEPQHRRRSVRFLRAGTCKKSRGEAPALGMVHAKIVRGGPPRQFLVDLCVITRLAALSLIRCSPNGLVRWSRSPPFRKVGSQSQNGTNKEKIEVGQATGY